ncbi:hypothetical protein DL770_003537 [Monosporascus sp. CRB-9-2]|nr:hypothetical protein DL770_003537 [Monosporascus sp. CRB-9-2]
MESLIKAVEDDGVKVLKPGNKEYEYAPRNTAQVQAVVREAKARKRRLTIKNGGHSYAGSSTTDGGILLDLSRMKRVTLDMEAGAEEVTLQGGARWSHAHKALVDEGQNDWVINGGRCPMVGVSGFVLGGGLSPFTRSFGMGCDTLLEATIVTADGRKVTVTSKDDRNKDKGKLFWALCGAGGGNFGVVVELKMRLQKLAGKNVVAGLFVWAPKPNAMSAFMETMVDFYTAKWPNRTTIDSLWLCNLDDAKLELKVRFPISHNGDKAEFDATIDKYIKNRELAKQLKLRSAAEPTLSSATGKYRIYTSVVLNNDRATITKVTTLIRKEMAGFRDRFTGEEGLQQVTWIHTGGEANRKKTASTTAFPWRTCAYHTYAMLDWKEKWLTRSMKGFLKKMKTELREYSIEGRAAFINFPDGELKAHEEAYFGSNAEALREVKKKWDADYFFKWRQGVGLPSKPQVLRAAPQAASVSAPSAEATTPGATPVPALVAGGNTDEAEEGVEEDDEADDYVVDKVPMAATARNQYEGGGALSLLDLGF